MALGGGHMPDDSGRTSVGSFTTDTTTSNHSPPYLNPHKRWYGAATRDTNHTTIALLDSDTSSPDAIRYIHLFIWQRRRIFTHLLELSPETYQKHTERQHQLHPTALPTANTRKSRTYGINFEDAVIEHVWPWTGIQKTKQEIGLFRRRLESWVERLDWDAERMLVARFPPGTRLRYPDPTEYQHKRDEQMEFHGGEREGMPWRHEVEAQSEGDHTMERQSRGSRTSEDCSISNREDTDHGSNFTDLSVPSMFTCNDSETHHDDASSASSYIGASTNCPRAQPHHPEIVSLQESLATAQHHAAECEARAGRHDSKMVDLEQMLIGAKREAVEHRAQADQHREHSAIVERRLDSARCEAVELRTRSDMQQRKIDHLEQSLISTRRQAEHYRARADQHDRQCQALSVTLSQQKEKCTLLADLAAKHFDMVKERTREKQEIEMELVKHREKESEMLSRLEHEMEKRRLGMEQEIYNARSIVQLQQDILKAELTQLIHTSEQALRRKARDTEEHLHSKIKDAQKRSAQQNKLLEEKLLALHIDREATHAALSSTEGILKSTQTTLDNTRTALSAATQEIINSQTTVRAAQAATTSCQTSHRELFISQQAYFMGQLENLRAHSSSLEAKLEMLRMDRRRILGLEMTDTP